MAKRLAASRDLTTEEWGGPDFILGSVAARTAEEAGGKQRTESFRLAVALSCPIAAARVSRASRARRPLSAGQEPLSLRPLGRGLARARTGLAAKCRAGGRGPLAADRGPRGSPAAGTRQGPGGDRDPAGRSPAGRGERRQVLVEQAQILLRMNRIQECAATLDRIPDNPLLRCDVSLLRGRLALAEGQALQKAAAPSPPGTGRSMAPLPKGEGSLPSPPAPLPKGEGSMASSPASLPKGEGRDAKEKFHAAIECFRKAMIQDVADNRVARQATYLIGLCLMAEGDLPAALNYMERTTRFFRETPESLAALYQEGEISRRLGRHAEAVSAYQRLMSAYSRQDEFRNPWLERAELQATLFGACQEYLKAEKYETAVLFSKLLAPLLPKLEALQLTARIYRTWGDNLMEQAEQLPLGARRAASPAGPHPVPPDRRPPVGDRPRAVYDPRVPGAALAQCRRLCCRPRLPRGGRNAADLSAQRVPPAARPGPGRPGRGRTLAGRDATGLAVVPRVHPTAPPRRGRLQGTAVGEPGRVEPGRPEAGRKLPAGQPQRRPIDARRQGMARFALRPGRASARCRTQPRGDPLSGRSLAALSRGPASDRRPLPAGRQFAAAGDGLAGGPGQGDIVRGPRRANERKPPPAEAGLGGLWIACRTTSAAATRSV